MFCVSASLRRLPLSFRVSLFYVILFLVSCAVFAALMRLAVLDAFARQTQRQLAIAAQELSVLWANTGTDGVLTRVRQSDLSSHLLMLVDARGRPSGEYVPKIKDKRLPRWDKLPTVKRHGLFSLVPTQGGHGENWIFLAQDVPGRGQLLLGQNTHFETELLENMNELLARVMGFSLVLTVLAGALLVHHALKPVRELAGTVRAIAGSGDLNRRAQLRGAHDELDILCVEFNRMMDRKQRLLQGMREVLDNAAHDLRSPLTRMRGTAEVALRGAPSPDAYRQALELTVAETIRMEQLFQGIYDLAQLEAGTVALELKTIGVQALLDEVVNLYAEVADEKKLVLTAEAAPELEVRGDRRFLLRAVANLVDNAIKFTSAGRIHLSGAPEAGGGIILSVEDTGCGIPPEDLPHLWERLFRGDRSRSTPGLGLGLSTVRAIAVAHGGEVGVCRTPKEGSRFWLRLPPQQESGA